MKNKWQEIKNILEDERTKIALDGLAELAKGVYILEETQLGTIRRYREKPDRQAAQFLVNRALERIFHKLTDLERDALL